MHHILKLLKNKWKNLKLSKKFALVFLGTGVTPLIISSVILYSVAYKGLNDSVRETTSVMSSQIVMDMNRAIDRYDAMSRSLLVNEEIMSRLSTNLPISKRVENQLFFRNIVISLMTQEKNIKSIAFINMEGEYYQLGRNGEQVDIENLMSKDWLQKWLQESNDQNYFLTRAHDTSYFYKNQDDIVITFGRKVYSSADQQTGIILIDLPVSSLISFSNRFLLERTRYNLKVNITDSDNCVIYDSDLASGQVHMSDINEQELLLYQKDPGSYLVFSDTTDRLGIRVNIIIPKTDILLRTKRLTAAAMVLSCVFILFIVIIAVYFSRSIVLVIHKLQESMLALEQEQYIKIEDFDGGDEIGDLVSSYNHMVTRLQQLIREVYVAQIQEKNAQFLALQTQINPHFLFNTLESIRMRALLSGNDDVAGMIKILAKMFRNVLDMDPSHHHVRDEIEYAMSYVRLQNIRFGDRLHLQLNVEHVLLDVPIIPVIFQPIIENSYKYGLREEGDLNIVLTGKRNGNGETVYIISDDGRGMTEEQLIRVQKDISENEMMLRKRLVDGYGNSTNIGLRNIAYRIRLRYGEKGRLEVRSLPDVGMEVSIYIPEEPGNRGEMN